jgi:hypothetical protein
MYKYVSRQPPSSPSDLLIPVIPREVGSRWWPSGAASLRRESTATSFPLRPLFFGGGVRREHGSSRPSASLLCATSDFQLLLRAERGEKKLLLREREPHFVVCELVRKAVLESGERASKLKHHLLEHPDLRASFCFASSFSGSMDLGRQASRVQSSARDLKLSMLALYR